MHSTAKHVTSLISASIFALLGLGSGSDDSPNSSRTPSSTAPSISEQGEPQPPRVYSKGEAVLAEDYKVTLEEVKTKTRVKDGFFKHKASEGAELLLLKIHVENVGKQQHMFTDNFSIVDQEEREFSTTSDCTMAVKAHIQFMDQLNPGLKKQGWLCFEVPKALVNPILKFEPSWLGDPIFIQLSEPVEPADAAPTEEQRDPAPQ